MGNTVAGVVGQLRKGADGVVLPADGHKKARCFGGLFVLAVRSVRK